MDLDIINFTIETWEPSIITNPEVTIIRGKNSTFKSFSST